jgi:hypothetical protein
MAEPLDIVCDYRGEPVLHCSTCGRALSVAEFFELGLRPLDSGESREEYCDAEVIDSVTHTACVAVPAG